MKVVFFFFLIIIIECQPVPTSYHVLRYLAMVPRSVWGRVLLTENSNSFINLFLFFFSPMQHTHRNANYFSVRDKLHLFPLDKRKA